MKYLLPCLLLLISSFAGAFEVEHDLGKVEFKEPPKRIIAIDWVMTESLLNLGVEPIGVADTEGYNDWVKKPALPQNILDVGARNEPNLELISKLKPDAIIITSFLAPAYDKLNKIAPTLMYGIYKDDKTPLKHAEYVNRQLGKLVGKSDKAESLIKETHDLLAANGEKIKAAHKNERPILFVRFIDNNTVFMQGEGSLLHSVISQMGLKDAWHDPTNAWGYSSVQIARVAEHQDARVFVLNSINKEEQKQRLSSPLWQAMAFSKEKRVHVLPSIWTYGGLFAVQQLSNEFTKSILEQPK